MVNTIVVPEFPDDEMQTLLDACTPLLFKLIIVGDSGVGKSCLLHRLVKNEARTDLPITIGTDFGEYRLIVESKYLMKLQIWDTAGQEQFRAITRTFYRDAHAALIVFDLTNQGSFGSLAEWLSEISSNVETRLVQFLCGNMSDLKRKVPMEEALQACEQRGIDEYWETSAFTGANVADMFKAVAVKLFERHRYELDLFVSFTARLTILGRR